jgi:hypothetical protein
MKHISASIIILAAAVIMVGSSHLAYAASGTNGYLVFEVERHSYSSGNTHPPDIHQKFKVPLTEGFMSNFKHSPNQNSGGNVKTNQGSTRFMWWIRKTADNRWRINMWGEGVETINGFTASSRNPKTSQNITVNRLEDIDMAYLLSYLNNLDGINVSFTAKYVSSEDIKTEGNIPAAAVRKADGTELFKGDDLKNFPLEVSCIFQEG